MDYIAENMSRHLKRNAIDNIPEEYSKIVGIESNLLVNENDKYVGRVVLLLNTKNVFLDQIIQFNKNKIKWRSSKCWDEGNKLYLVDPYWVKSYAPAPKIRVPVKVVVDGQIVIEMRDLNFKQFKQAKLEYFYHDNKVLHTLVSAYKNFYRMNKPGQYYKAINATVKNYFITQEQLVQVIALFNQERNRIKIEWNKHLNEHFQNNESAMLIDELFSKKSKTNVINFKK
jgi:hypothetical protein